MPSSPAASPATSGSSRWRSRTPFASGRIVVDQRHLHPGGYVHGGVWTALGDTVAAWATFRNIPPGHNFTTIELKLNVFSAGLLGDEIVAIGEPLHAGKSTVVIEVKIERIRGDEEPRLAANMIVTQFVLPPRAGLDGGGSFEVYRRLQPFDLRQAPEHAGDGQADRGREQRQEPLGGVEQDHFEEVAHRGGGEDQGEEGAEAGDEGQHVALDRDVLAARAALQQQHEAETEHDQRRRCGGAARLRGCRRRRCRRGRRRGSSRAPSPPRPAPRRRRARAAVGPGRAARRRAPAPARRRGCRSSGRRPGSGAGAGRGRRSPASRRAGSAPRRRPSWSGRGGRGGGCCGRSAGPRRPPAAGGRIRP